MYLSQGKHARNLQWPTGEPYLETQPPLNAVANQRARDALDDARSEAVKHANSHPHYHGAVAWRRVSGVERCLA